MNEVIHAAEEILVMAAIARALRAEQQMYAEGQRTAKSEGRLADAAALNISKWSVATKAAEIERDLRGFGDAP